MSKSRLPILVGVTAVGGIGYYLYQAGGQPKVARKQAEGMGESRSNGVGLSYVTVPASQTRANC